MQTTLEWQNHPLDPLYLIVWMDGIVFKVRDNGKIINKTVYLCVGLRNYYSQKSRSPGWHQ